MSEVKLSEKAKKVKQGFYKHYKGNIYRVLGVVVHSETLEEMVLYQAQYGKKLMWVRPLKMFFDNVEIAGNKVHRYMPIADK